MAAAVQQPHVNGTGTTSESPNSKIPSSVTRVYNVPLVHDSIVYADQVIKSYALGAAAYSRAEALATTVYKVAGEPIQDRLQGQIDQLDGLANKTLDYVQGKAPYIFDAKPEELVASARAPADQAYSTAKVYQDAVSGRLHDTLVASQQSLSSLQERLGAAAAVIPKNGSEAHQAAQHLYENLEAVKNTVLKQSHELPAHIMQVIQPYVEKLQKGAGDVKAELAEKDTPVHIKAQHIISITKEITSESLSDAIAALKTYTSKTKENGSHAITDGEKKATEAVETSQQFVEEHTPGNVSYAEAVKENATSDGQ